MGVDRGFIISGAGHLGLFGLMFIGPMFAAEPEPFEVTPVSTISGAEFEALLAQTSPNTPVPVAQPVAPAPLPEPEETAQPVIEPQDERDPVTPVAEPAPPVSEQAVAEDATESTPQATDRVAPEPVAAPDPEVRIDEVEQEAVTAESEGETQRDEQEATAQEEATTEIVTEAETPASLAPVTSRRPPSTRPAAPAVQDEPVETAQVETPEADPAPTPTAEPAAAPSGPPMSAGEKDALRVSVSNCWNVGSLSSEALRTTVVVAVNVGQDRKPDSGTIRMLSSSGGSDSAAKQAFEAARRAIIRCGARGFDLPDDKFDRWREMELTFNPEGMRMK